MPPAPKLTIAQIGEIKTLAAEGHTQVDLASQFGVNRATIAKALGPAPVEGFSPPGFTQSIPAENLIASPLNPRKTFDVETIDELAGSIAANGLLQNLVVRLLPDSNGIFQIIAGERRYRAIMKLVESGIWTGPIPCLVKDISEPEQLAMALLENLQRQDIPPLEEAEGLAALHAMDPEIYSAANIAEAIGKSTRYVYQRLALATKVIPQVKELFKQGFVNVEGARLLGQVKQDWQRDILIEFGLMDEAGEILTDHEPATPEHIADEIKYLELAEKRDQEIARHREHNASLDAQSSRSASGPINPPEGNDDAEEDIESRITRQNPDPPKSQPVIKAHIYHAHNRKTLAMRHAVCKHHHHAARLVCLSLVINSNGVVDISTQNFRLAEDRVEIAADHRAAIDAILGKAKPKGQHDDKAILKLWSFLESLPDGQVMKLMAHLVACHVGTFAGVSAALGDTPVAVAIARALGLHGEEESHGLTVQPEDLKGVRKQALLAMADEAGTPRINDELKPQEIADAIAEHSKKYVLPTLRFATTAEIEKALTFK